MGGSGLRRRGLLAVAAAAAVSALVAGSAALALPGATSSKVARLTVKCPANVAAAQRRVTCRGFVQRRRGPRGPRGLTGATGRRGAAGQRGAVGPAGVSGYETVNSAFENVAVPNSGAQRGLSAEQTVACPSGKRVISGGHDLGEDAAQGPQQRQVTVSRSAPNGTGNAWTVQLFNTSETTDTAIDLRVWAICARTG